MMWVRTSLIASLWGVGGVAASADGFLGLFTGGCPTGWSSFAALDGRLLLLTNNSFQAGDAVGFALADQEDRLHSHAVSGSFTFPSKHLSALTGTNQAGAKSGAQPLLPFLNESAPSPSGLPFLQLTACRFSALSLQPPPVLPVGGLALWDPASAPSGCPAGSAPVDALGGRALAVGSTPGWALSEGSALHPGASDMPHAHAFSASISLESTEYVGIGGCCDDETTSSGSHSMTGATSDATLGLPDLTLLACNTTTASGDAVPIVPPGMVFLSLLGALCPTGWLPLPTPLSGRYVVATPAFGVPSSAWGGAPIPGLGAGFAPTHTHTFRVAIDVVAAGVALDSGCCAKGYGASGAYSAGGVTDAAGGEAATGLALPFAIVQACVQA